MVNFFMSEGGLFDVKYVVIAESRGPMVGPHGLACCRVSLI